MRGSELLDKMNLIDSIYVEAVDFNYLSGEIWNSDSIKSNSIKLIQVKDTNTVNCRRKKSLIIAAVLMIILMMGVATAALMSGSDLWIESPSKDPVKCVESVLENQTKKDYATKLEIESIEVDLEETQRVREKFIKGVIAERQGWSDEYLEEHFVVVKAKYYAEYDQSMTTRGDGDVIQYFYLVRDTTNGKWSIVDNSGNLNRQNEINAGTEHYNIDAMPHYEKEVFTHLSEVFNEVYSTYYDGLHYEISNYTETTSENQYVAEFMWTMYFLGKPWDIASDKDVEQEANFYLQVKIPIDGAGNLNMKKIIIMGDSSVKGPPVYNIPLEEFFPDQLAE